MRCVASALTLAIVAIQLAATVRCSLSNSAMPDFAAHSGVHVAPHANACSQSRTERRKPGRGGWLRWSIARHATSGHPLSVVRKRASQVSILGVEPFLRTDSTRVSHRPRHISMPSNLRVAADMRIAIGRALVPRPRRMSPPTNFARDCNHRPDVGCAATPTCDSISLSPRHARCMIIHRDLCARCCSAASASAELEVRQIFPSRPSFPWFDPFPFGVVRSSSGMRLTVGSVPRGNLRTAGAAGMAQSVPSSASPPFLLRTRRLRRRAFIAPLNSPRVRHFSVNTTMTRISTTN